MKFAKPGQEHIGPAPVSQNSLARPNTCVTCVRDPGAENAVQDGTKSDNLDLLFTWLTIIQSSRLHGMVMLRYYLSVC